MSSPTVITPLRTADGCVVLDAKKDKGLAKLMIVMTSLINREHIPKLHPDKPEKATCLMCHRGTNEPRDTVETYRMPATRPPS